MSGAANLAAPNGSLYRMSRQTLGVLMSWVTDIILLSGLEEQYPESGEVLTKPRAIAAVNTWLKNHGWAPLVRLDDRIGMRTESAFQACAYGAALNRLDIPAFLRAVGEQAWEAPRALLLLLKDEEDRRFTVYRMGRGRRLKKCS